jgi:hypothetical protein
VLISFSRLLAQLSQGIDILLQAGDRFKLKFNLLKVFDPLLVQIVNIVLQFGFSLVRISISAERAAI